MTYKSVDISSHFSETNEGEDVRIYFKDGKKTKLFKNIKTPFLLFDELRKADPNVRNYVVVTKKKTQNSKKWW